MDNIEFVCDNYGSIVFAIADVLDKQKAKKVIFKDWYPYCLTCNNDRLYTEDNKNMKYCSECG